MITDDTIGELLGYEIAPDIKGYGDNDGTVGCTFGGEPLEIKRAIYPAAVFRHFKFCWLPDLQEAIKAVDPELAIGIKQHDCSVGNYCVAVVSKQLDRAMRAA